MILETADAPGGVVKEGVRERNGMARTDTSGGRAEPGCTRAADVVAEVAGVAPCAATCEWQFCCF